MTNDFTKKKRIKAHRLNSYNVCLKYITLVKLTIKKTIKLTIYTSTLREEGRTLTVAHTKTEQMHAAYKTTK